MQNVKPEKSKKNQKLTRNLMVIIYYLNVSDPYNIFYQTKLNGVCFKVPR